MQAQGKDLTLVTSGTPLTCQTLFTATDCAILAVQLSRLIDGSLPPGSGSEERTGFLQSVAPLGYSPCSTRGT